MSTPEAIYQWLFRLKADGRVDFSRPLGKLAVTQISPGEKQMGHRILRAKFGTLLEIDPRSFQAVLLEVEQATTGQSRKSKSRVASQVQGLTEVGFRVGVLPLLNRYAAPQQIRPGERRPQSNARGQAGLCFPQPARVQKTDRQQTLGVEIIGLEAEGSAERLDGMDQVVFLILERTSEIVVACSDRRNAFGQAALHFGLRRIAHRHEQSDATKMKLPKREAELPCMLQQAKGLGNPGAAIFRRSSPTSAR